MSNIRFKLNSAGVRNVLHMAGDVCGQHAARIAAAAGEGYRAEKRSYPERTGYAVYPSTEEAARDNLNNDTLQILIRRGG